MPVIVRGRGRPLPDVDGRRPEAETAPRALPSVVRSSRITERRGHARWVDTGSRVAARAASYGLRERRVPPICTTAAATTMRRARVPCVQSETRELTVAAAAAAAAAAARRTLAASASSGGSTLGLGAQPPNRG